MGQIAEIIKYEGNNSTFIWKHPSEDFNSLTQLVVHETQEAIFFMNGQALDLFGPGRYTLETQNIPKLGGLLKRSTGDKTPFHCEVYFINKSEQMSIKWGTDSKVQYVEPTYGFPISIGARGEMSIRADDSRKLLLKLVGTENMLSQAKLVEYFRAFLMTKVKSYIAQTIKANKINIFEIDEHLTTFSEDIHKLLIPDFQDYGVVLERFFVTSILKPDGEPQYEKFKDLHFRQYADIQETNLNNRIKVMNAEAEAQKTIIESQARATSRAQEGYTRQWEDAAQIMDDLAKNEGTGSDLRNAAMGLGIGFGVGGPLGSAMRDLSQSTMSGLMDPAGKPAGVAPAAQPQAQEEPVPGMINLKAEGKPEAAPQPVEDDMAVFKKKIEKLTLMKEAGLLTDEEFQEQKKQLLAML